MKLEFIGLKMYQVIAKYLEVDGVPCVVEMISCLDDGSRLLPAQREEKHSLRNLHTTGASCMRMH